MVRKTFQKSLKNIPENNHLPKQANKQNLASISVVDSPRQNKRKVFSDNDSDTEIEPKRTKSKFNQDQKGFSLRSYDAMCSLFWKFLHVKGPLTGRNFKNTEIFKNRPLSYFAYELSESLQRNFIAYQETELVTIQNRFKSLNIDGVMELLEDMCRKTMKYESTEFSVVFNLEDLLSVARQVLIRKVKRYVTFDNSSVFLQQLRSILLVKNIQFSENELILMRNEYLAHFGYVQMSYVKAIVVLRKHHKYWRTNILVPIPQDIFFHDSTIDVLSNCASMHRLKFILMLRGWESSLWTLIPYEGKRHLLELSVQHGLVKCLPPNVRQFLDDWMILVQKRMRKRLKSGDLKRVADSLLEGQEKSVDFNSPLIGEFLEKIIDNVLNCQDNFQVFHKSWMNLLLETIGDLKYATCLGSREWITEELFDFPQFRHLASLFSTSKSDVCLLNHLKTNLFYFFIQFCYHTIRFVFKIDFENRVFNYDGELEDEKVVDFKEIDRIEETLEKENSRSQDPFPVEIPKVQVIKPRKTLLPSPFIPQPTVPPRTFDVSQQYLVPTNVPLSNCAVYPQNDQEYYFNPIPPTPLVVHPPKIERTPKTEPLEPNLSAEVTEEELKSARALRTPSEVSGGLSGKMDEDEEIPKKWRDAYRLLMEWNHDLKDELKNVKERYEKFN